jgi:hypothetical protein
VYYVNYSFIELKKHEMRPEHVGEEVDTAGCDKATNSLYQWKCGSCTPNDWEDVANKPEEAGLGTVAEVPAPVVSEPPKRSEKKNL